LDKKKHQKNLFNLDILRTVAVTLVLISHLPNLEFPSYYEQRGLGLLGVVIFFVHTSFVLMSSLERINSKNIINYKFYIRRIFRIYPLSIFAVCLYSYIGFISDYKLDLNSFFSNIFLIQNFTQAQSTPIVLWSLPYEIQMYFFLPFVFMFIKTKKKILMLYIALCIFVILLKLFNNDKKYYDFFHFMPIFLSGCISFFFFSTKNKINSFYLLIFIMLVCLSFPILLKIGVKENLLGTIFALPLGVLIAYSKQIKHDLINKFCNIIAKYSYGIYLFHLLIIDIFFKYLNSNLHILINYFFVYSSTLLFSYIFFNLIEKPFIKFGKKISNNY